VLNIEWPVIQENFEHFLETALKRGIIPPHPDTVRVIRALYPEENRASAHHVDTFHRATHFLDLDKFRPAVAAFLNFAKHSPIMDLSPEQEKYLCLIMLAPEFVDEMMR